MKRVSGRQAVRRTLLIGIASVLLVETALVFSIGDLRADVLIVLTDVALLLAAAVFISAPDESTAGVPASVASDYVAVIAHEMGSPIVAIGAAAQVLARELHGRESERKALAIAEEARQAYRLLESLSDLSSLETGRMRLSLRTLDLADLARGGFALVEGADRRVVVDAPEGPVLVIGDDRRIRQVVQNLVSNAVKYSAPGTAVEVRVGCTADRRSAIVQVRDHGPGIPPPERPRLFGKFARLSTAGAQRGSGLGLYISRAIVLDHHGEMWGEWPASGGSIFSFTLPLATQPAIKRATEPLAG